MLTTNRVETLKRALVERPGRIDLAVEAARPDATGREKLLRLYAHELTWIFPTQAGWSPPPRRVNLNEAALQMALAELSSKRQALTRSLLGAVNSPQP